MASKSSIVISNWPPWTQHPESTHQKQTVSFTYRDGAPLEKVRFRPSTEDLFLSRRDAYHIAFLLRQVLIPDVVPQIMFHAKIVSTCRYDRTETLAVHKDISPYTYVVTPPIYAPVRRRSPVVAVRISLDGFEEDVNWRYVPSLLRAGVLRGVEANSLDEPDQVRVFANMPSLEGEKAVVEYRAPGFKMHEYRIPDVMDEDLCDGQIFELVDWSCDSEDAGESEWVAGLANGDRIVVRAWAEGTTRFEVHGVCVEVDTAIIVK